MQPVWQTPLSSTKLQKWSGAKPDVDPSSCLRQKVLYRGPQEVCVIHNSIVCWWLSKGGSKAQRTFEEPGLFCSQLVSLPFRRYLETPVIEHWHNSTPDNRKGSSEAQHLALIVSMDCSDFWQGKQWAWSDKHWYQQEFHLLNPKSVITPILPFGYTSAKDEILQYQNNERYKNNKAPKPENYERCKRLSRWALDMSHTQAAV